MCGRDKVNNSVPGVILEKKRKKRIELIKVLVCPLICSSTSERTRCVLCSLQVFNVLWYSHQLQVFLSSEDSYDKLEVCKCKTTFMSGH